nr:reverse transcriptase domain-containing protein [Tanacetum cinerariifolium]
MADQRTITELLRTPTEGYAEAIVVPPILAEQFELKNSLINMMTSDKFLGLEKDNPHDHIRWFNKITSTIKYKDVPNSAIKLMLFPFSLAGAVRRWQEKEPSRSILTWEDLVSKFINEFFPPQEQQISVMKFQTFNKEGELKDITTRSGIVLDGPSIAIPPPFIYLEEDERVEETLMDPDLTEYTIKKMLKALLSNKEKLLELANAPLNENCLAVILKKLPEKLGDPGKFLILCGFSEIKYKALADLGASINLMPLSVWKKLGIPDLISTCMTLELANRAICTPAGIARDVFVSVGKFTFLAYFVIVDYEIDPRVPLILGRPFLWTAPALIDLHREEMILRDGDEILALNMRHDTSSYSNQPQKESIIMINICDDSSGDFLEELFTTNHQSGNPTFSSHPNLTSPKVKDDVFDPDQVLKPLFPFLSPLRIATLSWRSLILLSLIWIILARIRDF